jgi:tRNA (adenine37-N6)-methyltransferase
MLVQLRRHPVYAALCQSSTASHDHWMQCADIRLLPTERIMEFIMKPIGIIHSPFKDKKTTPIQAARSPAAGDVILYPAYEAGLEGIEGFSYLTLIYVFHLSDGYSLSPKPFLDDQEHGLFTTRHPHRPNPIGISTVKLVERIGNRLIIEGVDVLDGTPLLDIKPYIPDFDYRPAGRIGWYENRKFE